MFSNVRLLSIWNVWSAPFGTEFIFHRHDQIRHINDKNVLKLMHDNNAMDIINIDNDSNDINDSHLIISTFQEAFSFRDIPYLFNFYSKISPQTLYNHPYKLSYFYECIVCSFAILFRPFQKNSNAKLYSLQSKIFNSTQALIPFKYAIGIDGESMSTTKPYQMFVDSGLLILCNWKPIKTGFIPYKSQPKSWFEWNEESLANKGMLYGYWVKNDVATIVINTHITTQSLVKKYLELKELQNVVNELKEKYVGKTKYLEIYAVGDFNVPYDNVYLQEVMENQLDFRRYRC